MDKGVIFAVAGSGKTASIVEKLNENRRSLLITYTNNTHEDLRRRVIKRFGYLPKSISINTYFSFLYRFCYRPYLSGSIRDKGLCFNNPPDFTRRLNKRDMHRYLTKDNRVYHNRLASLLEIKGCIPELTRRIERYYDAVYIDEVQDYSGHDFNFLEAIWQANVDWNLVGDFYQHTYSSSHDGNVNISLHENYDSYQKRFQKAGLSVDTTSLLASHRCPDAVCSFIKNKIGIDISTASPREGKVEIIEKQSDADQLHADPSIVKLFYKEPQRYGCYSLTWGSSKGLDHFDDVCVALNSSTWDALQKDQLQKTAPLTRNKLYVACSRARKNLYFVPEKLFKWFKAPRIKNV